MAAPSKHSLLIRQLSIATAGLWLVAYLYVHSAARTTETMANAKSEAAIETKALLNQVAKTSSSDPIAVAALEHQMAVSFFSARQYKEAEPHFQRWLELTHKYATSTAHVTEAMSSVANFYRDWRKYEAAALLYRQAEDLDRQNMDTDPAPLIRDWNNSGVLDFLWGQACVLKEQRKQHFDLAAVWFKRAREFSVAHKQIGSGEAPLLKIIERNIAVMDYEVREPAWPG
jgi:tetratricopeptide (TPR) repeat protein